jgi:hypothetical protein
LAEGNNDNHNNNLIAAQQQQTHFFFLGALNMLAPIKLAYSPAFTSYNPFWPKTLQENLCNMSW